MSGTHRAWLRREASFFAGPSFLLPNWHKTRVSLSGARSAANVAARLGRQPVVAKSRTPIEAKDLKGLKYFKLLASLLNRLLDDATARDRAGNRRLFYDQYACLLLLSFFLSFFNPIVKSLRGIQQASELEKVQSRRAGIRLRPCFARFLERSQPSFRSRIAPRDHRPSRDASDFLGRRPRSRGVARSDRPGVPGESPARLAQNGLGVVARSSAPRRQDARPFRRAQGRSDRSHRDDRQRFGNRAIAGHSASVAPLRHRSRQCRLPTLPGHHRCPQRLHRPHPRQCRLERRRRTIPHRRGENRRRSQRPDRLARLPEKRQRLQATPPRG